MTGPFKNFNTKIIAATKILLKDEFWNSSAEFTIFLKFV